MCNENLVSDADISICADLQFVVCKQTWPMHTGCARRAVDPQKILATHVGAQTAGRDSWLCSLLGLDTILEATVVSLYYFQKYVHDS